MAPQASGAALASQESTINIIGAGVFGLSTAIHLAERGFKNIRIFDRQPYERSQYNYGKGCDAASADYNKIFRTAYGAETFYQQLSLEALQFWRAWNNELASAKPLPPGFDPGDKVYFNGGNLLISQGMVLPAFERLSLKTMQRLGFGDTQYVVGDPKDAARARKDGLEALVDPFKVTERGRPFQGMLDTVGGFVYADKACLFALHKAKALGVKLFLGEKEGSCQELIYEGPKVSGIVTADGKTHSADLTVVACGGWTPTVVPQLEGLCETTAGSVAIVQIPRESPLYDRLAPENFPTWTYRIRDGPIGGLYGFPRDSRGHLKIGYRGTKYTNPQPISSTAYDPPAEKSKPKTATRSVPITRYTSPSLNSVPKDAIDTIRNFLNTFLPELGASGIDIEQTRLCWYTDTFDNHFVIDAVPDTEGSLVVATGGSGHAFKFLPTIGKYVADRIQGRRPKLDSGEDILAAWQWRNSGERIRKGVLPKNVLGEGVDSIRALQNVAMSTEADLKLGQAYPPPSRPKL